MRLYPAVAAAVVLGTLGSSASLPQSTDEAAIRKLGDRYVLAFNKGDAKSLASLYDIDAVFIDESGTVERGQAEIERAYGETFADVAMKGARLALKQGPVRFLKPDVALSDGSYEIAGVKGPDGRLLPPIHGLYSNAFIKKGGRWVLAGLAAFVPLAPPPASAKQ